jgi:hypothetical protein
MASPKAMSEPRKQLSPVRRIVRVFVWTLFGLVLFVRFVAFRQEPPRRVEQTPFWAQQQLFPRGPGPRFRRPPTFVHDPVGEIPKDLLRIQIDVAPQDADRLRGYFWNGWRGRPQDRPEVPATVREGGRVYTNVTLHLKGAAGSFRPFDDKPALTLNFSKHAPGQRFHDYTKLSLNNSVQDPTWVCEALCRDLYNRAGVPAPKADWATVLVNGRDLGLYVMIEGYNKEFLRRHFKNVKGNLYDGGFVQEISGNLGVNSGDHPEDRSDIGRLIAAASQPEAAARWRALNQVLDVDRFMTFMALEVMMCNWDGYCLNHNNYRLYHDLDADRMIFMPHGMDQMFDFPPGTRFPTDGSIHPLMKGLVARAIMGTADGPRRYYARMAELQTNFFRADDLIARVQQLAQHIRPTLAAYDPGVAQMHDSAVASLCERIRQRVASLDEQLAEPRAAVQFDSSGILQLADWNQHLQTQGSQFQFGSVDQAGKRVLRIAAINSGGTGSWRSPVRLDVGQYRFEGRARVSASAVGGRVCLRISHSQTPATLVQTTDWIPLSFTFSIDSLSEVVLVCEFAGARGEALFDVDSLRLTRQ